MCGTAQFAKWNVKKRCFPSAFSAKASKLRVRGTKHSNFPMGVSILSGWDLQLRDHKIDSFIFKSPTRTMWISSEPLGSWFFSFSCGRAGGTLYANPVSEAAFHEILAGSTCAACLGIPRKGSGAEAASNSSVRRRT